MGAVNQEDQLTRIADTLEEISTELSEIDRNIDSKDRDNFLCITGNVSTY